MCTPLKNISQLGYEIPNIWKFHDVPNHQPAIQPSVHESRAVVVYKKYGTFISPFFRSSDSFFISPPKDAPRRRRSSLLTLQVMESAQATREHARF